MTEKLEHLIEPKEEIGIPNSDIQNKTIVSPKISSPEQHKYDPYCLIHECWEDELVERQESISETRKQLAREIREKINEFPRDADDYYMMTKSDLDKILAEYETEEK